jgi:hypothetical protein
MEVALKPTDEFSRKCMAEWGKKAGDLGVKMLELSMEIIDKMHYVCPPATPQKLLDFREFQKSDSFTKKSTAEKDVITSRFYKKDEIVSFMKAESSVTAENMSNAMWCDQLLDLWFQRGDKVNFLKVWDVYKRYPNRLGKVWRKSLRWNKEDSHMTRAKEMAKEIFRGVVVDE